MSYWNNVLKTYSTYYATMGADYDLPNTLSGYQLNPEVFGVRQPLIHDCAGCGAPAAGRCGYCGREG